MVSLHISPGREDICRSPLEEKKGASSFLSLVLPFLVEKILSWNARVTSQTSGAMRPGSRFSLIRSHCFNTREAPAYTDSGPCHRIGGAVGYRVKQAETQRKMAALLLTEYTVEERLRVPE